MKTYLLVLALSFLPLTSIFTAQDLLHTHDGLVHLPRIAAYFKALSDGQIPVRWAGDLNYGYGMPLFNFLYQLPYFLASIFILLGASLVASFKLTLALSHILAGVFMYAFARKFLSDERKALLVTIFYQFASFRLVELLIRGSFGEVYTYTFLPLVLFGLISRSFFITAFSTVFLVLSHNSVSLLFFLSSFIFILFFAESKKSFLLSTAALMTGLALSAFYWIPAIFEHQYTYGDLFMKNLYLSHFAPLQNFFIPNFTNSTALQTGGVSTQIGLFHIIAIFLFLLFILTRKTDIKTKRLFVFCSVLFLIPFFFMQPISKLAWENLALLRQFQFPWRFLSIIVFATSLASVSFLSFNFFKKQLIYILLIFLVIISTVFYWRTSVGADKIQEDYYWNFPLNTTYYGETDLIWSAGPASTYPKERVEIIAGEGKISDLTKKSNLHAFTVEAKTDVSVVDHTQFFPGWRAYVNGKPVPIQFQDPSWRGQITFPVSRGTSSVEIVFAENKLRLAADMVSLLSLTGILLIAILKARKVV